MLAGLQTLPNVTVHGLTDPSRLAERVPTVAFTWPRLSPRATVEYLGANGICAWSGNYYALRLMERLDLEAFGGAVRVGAAHYNTRAEVDRIVALLHDAPPPR